MPSRVLQPLLFLIARSTHSHLAQQVEFLKAENEILRSKLPKQVRTTVEERGRLLTLGRRLGSSVRDLISIVSFATFQRWMRGDVRRGDLRASAVGRPRTSSEMSDLVVRLARENGWGACRIHGELKKLGIDCICVSTVRNILVREGIPHAPKRGPGSWHEFLRRHAETIWACDFVSTRILTMSGFHNCFAFFAIHIATRRVFIGGVTVCPDCSWMAQQARNLSMHFDDQPFTARYLIHDADSKYTAQFRSILAATGVETKGLPPRSPNLNAFAERWVRSLRYECLNHFIVFGENHLRHLVCTYTAWYNEKRPHQSLGNRPPFRSAAGPGFVGMRGAMTLNCHGELGGLLNHYYWDAA